MTKGSAQWYRMMAIKIYQTTFDFTIIPKQIDLHRNLRKTFKRLNYDFKKNPPKVD